MLLERREQRGGLNQASRRDTLARLARRGILAYAERAILLRRSTAPWRMGHGSLAPFELLTGSGSLDLMVESIRVLRELVEQQQKMVFVASEPSDRFLLTIGDALRPLEYAIVRSLRDVIHATVENAHYRSQYVTADTRWDGVKLSPVQFIQRFRDEVASQVVVGLYRATRLGPPQVFYAHAEHADLAAHIAMADSVLQEHRGFPLLIDPADTVCRGVFGSDTLEGPIETAYAEAGARFGLAEADVRRLRRAGLVHGLGRLGVSKPTVPSWRDRSRDGGIAALDDRPRSGLNSRPLMVP